MPTVTWQPLPGLTTGERRAAAAAIDAIAHDLKRPPPPVYPDPANAVGLAAREPGFALFFTQLFEHARNARFRSLATKFLERAIEAVPAASEKPYLSHGYS